MRVYSTPVLNSTQGVRLIYRVGDARVSQTGLQSGRGRRLAVMVAGKVAEKEVHVEGVRSWPRSEGGGL